MSTIDYGTYKDPEMLDDLVTRSRAAYKNRDVKASMKIHSQATLNRNHGHQEMHMKHGNLLKSVIYGGLDGIMTSFATVTSVSGGGLAHIVILVSLYEFERNLLQAQILNKLSYNIQQVVGVAHLFADGISMGMGDAISSKACIKNNIFFID
jgi:hypothetical protein